MTQWQDSIPIDGTTWEDLRFPVQSLKIGATRQPTWTAFFGGYVLGFADQAVAGNEEIIFFVAQIPHSYQIGQDIEAHVHWVGQDNSAGVVRWKMTYSWASIYGVFPSESTVYSDSSNSLVSNTHNLASFGMLPGDGKGISSMVICSLSRNSSNAADTYTGKSAYLLEIDFHVPSDTAGSRRIFQK